MNILILTENYTKGGLETHIATYYNQLKNDNNIFFAIGNYEEYGLLPEAKIETGFHFGFDVTIGDFINDVNRLVELIIGNKIDVIHVHPFYSVYQALFAAQITNTKLVYTYHGPGSLTFTANLFDEIMFEVALETTISSVISVSQRGAEGFKRLEPKSIVIIPNAIDDKLYKKTKVIKNKKWAIVSRLDSDKYDAIEELLKNIDNIDIDEIDVWGDGNKKKELENISKSLKKKIVFKGFSTNLCEELLNKYNGVIGIGRAAMEGLVMGYPVMLVGNKKNCGVIDDDLYEKTKNHNFTARAFNQKSIEEINKQLKLVYSNTEKYIFREQIIKEFGINEIADRYVKHLEGLPEQIQNSSVISLFSDLSQLDEKIRFHDDYNIINLLNEYIYIYTNNIFIKNKIMILNNMKKEKMENQAKFDELLGKYNELKEKNSLLKSSTDTLIKENEKKINTLCHSNSRLEYQLEYLSNNITTKTIIRNNLRKLINIFRKNKRSE